MDLTSRTLALPASAPSVQLARSWVGDMLREIDRTELVESARLGVSELVTNAIIHGRPPLAVRLGGTRERPRIEVIDGSPVPPSSVGVAPTPEEVDPENLTTFGRGLTLVAMVSQRWGSDLAHDGSNKSVWFEPATDADDDEQVGELFSDAQEHVPLDEASVERLAVDLLRVPARLFGELRRHHFETRRELRLLAMTDPEAYPIAAEVTTTFARADHERRMTDGVKDLDAAIAAKQDVVDLEYQVPSSAPRTMSQLRRLLDEVYDLFSEENLLANRPPQLLLDLQTWYFGEFERQADGERPLPWEGPTALPG